MYRESTGNNAKEKRRERKKKEKKRCGLNDFHYYGLLDQYRI